VPSRTLAHVEQTVGAFLQSRRARISPEEAGLVSRGRRRVPGLRREELAELAGVSADYYVRLEQGRATNVSVAVLDAVARILRLDDVEHQHLRNLVRGGRPSVRTAPAQVVRPELQRLLDLMETVPAFVLGRRMDIIAWNALADGLCRFGAMAFRERNAARHTFLDPGARTFYTDWETVAAETVAYLRLDAGRHPEDPRLSELVDELAVKDADFRRLWAAQEVKEKTYGAKLLQHPVVGALELGYETFAPPGDPGQLLVAYTADPDSPTADRLRLLASWNATDVSLRQHH